jgi:HEAT repeat protein
MNTNARIEKLIKRLKNDDCRRRATAAEKLGKLSDFGDTIGKVINVLVNTLRNDDAGNVRSAAAEALGNLRVANDEVIDVLTDVLSEDENRYVRARAAEALGKLGNGGDVVVDALLDTLANDDISAIRTIAAESLGNLRVANDDVIDALRNAAKDVNEDVSAQATKTLERLNLN